MGDIINYYVEGDIPIVDDDGNLLAEIENRGYTATVEISGEHVSDIVLNGYGVPIVARQIYRLDPNVPRRARFEELYVVSYDYALATLQAGHDTSHLVYPDDPIYDYDGDLVGFRTLSQLS